MTYKLPEPVGLAEPTQALSLAKDLLSDGRRYSAEQMQAAYAAGQRDMLERAIALFAQPHVDHAGAEIVDKLKELLNASA